MDFTYKEVFVLVKFLVWIVTLGMQYWLYRASVPHVERAFPAPVQCGKYRIHTHHLLASIIVFINLPGIYIAFGGSFGIPWWMVKITVYPYALWQIVTGVVLLVVLPLRSLFKRLQNAFRKKRGLLPDKQEESVSEPAEILLPTRRKILKAAAVGAPVYLLGASSLSALTPENYEIRRRTIRLPHLPEKLKGLRVAVISDIHSGPFMNKQQLDGYVNIINQQKADIILLPGDFVNNKSEEVYPLAESFRQLRADYGVYASLGNHDCFDNEDIVAREMTNAGITMLRDANAIIDPRGERFALIGLEDLGPHDSFHTHFRKAIAGVKKTTPHILLCHKPYYVDKAAQWGVQCMVSGHTHGGQIVLARVLNTALSPASLVSQYLEGLYTVDATQMYVTRGIGMVGVPIRWNCPPEITVLTLK